MLCAQGEIGSNSSESIEDMKDQVRASKSGGTLLCTAGDTGMNLGPGGVGWDALRTSVVSGSPRMESLPGSFLPEGVHRVRRHSVRADSELMGHSVML